RLNEDEISLETIDQSYLIVEEREKFKHLCNFIRNREKGQQTIVFVATKQRTQRIADDLNKEVFKLWRLCSKTEGLLNEQVQERKRGYPCSNRYCRERYRCSDGWKYY